MTDKIIAFETSNEKAGKGIESFKLIQEREAIDVINHVLMTFHSGPAAMIFAETLTYAILHRIIRDDTNDETPLSEEEKAKILMLLQVMMRHIVSFVANGKTPENTALNLQMFNR